MNSEENQENLPIQKSLSFNAFYDKYIGSFFTGIWLFFLYFICSITVVYSLSAHQLNDAIKDYASEDTQNLGMAQIKDRYWQWIPLQKQFDSSTSRVIELTNKLRASQDERVKLEKSLSNSKAQYETALDDIANIAASKGFKADQVRVEYDTVNRELTSTENAADTTSLRSQIETGLAPNDPIFAAINRSDVAASSLRALDAQIATLGYEIGQTDESITRENDAAAQLSCRIIRVQTVDSASVDCERTDGATLGQGTQEIGDFLNALRFFAPERAETKPLPSDPFYKRIVSWFKGFNLAFLITMPAEMLTMFMVISMGALGGTIHLTQIFLSRKKLKNDSSTTGLWYFLFRPMLGCIVAITVFILVHAGVLVVATPSTQNADSTLSPYFVSFLGIISGLLAQNAVETIQTTGARWFSNADTLAPSRWAYSLQSLLDEGSDAEQETVKSELSKILNVPTETILDWAREDEAVPHKYQTTIAAFFRKPVRELFSDLRKNKMRVEETPSAP